MNSFFDFWSLWIVGLTSANLILVTWVLLANRKVAVKDDEDPENKTTGHVYDGIEEYDNPLPKWWFQMFIATIVFAVIYLIIYPGMGAYKGLPIFGESTGPDGQPRGFFDGVPWTSRVELRTDQAEARESYVDSFGKYMTMSVEDLAKDPQAMKMGTRLFANNCAVCHGSDGGGQFGFPDLTDNDWLYGGTPEKIKETLIHGRRAAGMVAWGEQIGEDGVVNVSEYVLSLGGKAHDAAKAELGKSVFMTCAACHGADGKGNQLVGAPNLTDDIWLYGGSPEEIRQSVRAGRAGHMPAQKDLLREDKIHLLTAYVYQLSMDADEE